MFAGTSPRNQRFARVALWLALTFSFFAAPSADAVIYYFEFGGGLGKISEATAVNPEATENETSGGASVPLTLGVNLQSRQWGPLFQLGLQARYVTGSAGGATATVLTTSPVFRIEFWRLFAGVGYSPWVWKDVSFKKLQLNALTYEGGFLFPITPEIDFGLQAAMQTLKPKSGGGPEAKTLEYGAFFRLNFGLSSQNATARRKYKGWRYPFGNPLN